MENDNKNTLNFERMLSTVRLDVADFHSHVLPEMDDGSESLAMSIELLQRLAEQGVQTVCCTSHYYANRETAAIFCERRQKALCRLQSSLPTESLRLIPGAEVAWFPKISAQDLTPLCLQGTRTLLLEMPFAQWNQHEVEEVISLVLDRGYQVALAHPERFCFDATNRRYLAKLGDLPVGLQVNAETLYRWRTRKQGLALLRQAQYPLLGSDCHNLTRRPPYIKQARQVIRRCLGEETLEQIDRNAQAAICGTGWGN